jgi:hypothetical protein
MDMMKAIIAFFRNYFVFAPRKSLSRLHGVSKQRIFPVRWGEFWNITACRNAIRQNASEYWHIVSASFVAELKQNRRFDSELI